MVNYLDIDTKDSSKAMEQIVGSASAYRSSIEITRTLDGDITVYGELDDLLVIFSLFENDTHTHMSLYNGLTDKYEKIKA